MPDFVIGSNGKPIVPGARVYVRPRPGMGGCGELLGFGGIVLEVRPDCITLTEFGTFHSRDIRPRDVSVQSGETRSSIIHRAAMNLGRK
jgi:hypothetical protein